MEDDPPIGTQVIVFRLDGLTVVGEGVIEGWLLFCEIPDDIEPLADTRRIGVQTEFDPESFVVVSDDGAELSVEQALEESETRIPRIRLESGEVTYGSCCYWRSLAEHQASEKN